MEWAYSQRKRSETEKYKQEKTKSKLQEAKKAVSDKVNKHANDLYSTKIYNVSRAH